MDGMGMRDVIISNSRSVSSRAGGKGEEGEKKQESEEERRGWKDLKRNALWDCEGHSFAVMKKKVPASW